MADAQEIVDDLTPTVEVGKVVYTVRKPPYLVASTHVYINGMLQDPSWHVELDPVLGTVQLEEALLVRAVEDHSLHVAYRTFQAPYVDPTDPIHISRLVQGNVVRIAMKPGKHLEPVRSPRGQQTRLQTRERNRVARNSGRTVILLYVMQNDRVNGVLYGQVERRGSPRNHAAATVPYGAIQHIQRYTTPGKPRVDDVEIGGGPRAVRRPGVVARGFADHPGFMQLTRVYF